MCLVVSQAAEHVVFLGQCNFDPETWIKKGISIFWLSLVGKLSTSPLTLLSKRNSTSLLQQATSDSVAGTLVCKLGLEAQIREKSAAKVRVRNVETKNYHM